MRQRGRVDGFAIVRDGERLLIDRQANFFIGILDGVVHQNGKNLDKVTGVDFDFGGKVDMLSEFFASESWLQARQSAFHE